MIDLIVKGAEITALKNKLLNYRMQRKSKKSKIDDYVDALDGLAKKRREIEEGLQETANTISRWLERIPQKSRFRTKYYETAKSKFLNPKSTQALERVREAERTVRRKLNKLDDEVEVLDKKIRDLEQKIQQLERNPD